MKSPNPLLHVLCIIKTCPLNFFQKLIVCLVLLLSNYGLYSQQLAFPTAAGFGKHTTGGRGGAVIKVTNLNDSGSGSFRAALEASGTRTVVFEVGGTISLINNIYVSNGNLTIAGQTASGDGILIKGGMVQIESSNVIVRHIRFRPGPSSPDGTDAVSITAWSGSTVENIIFDHCSISWGADENFNIRGVNGGIVRKVTLQNSIISECGYGTLGLTGTYNLTFYKNLFAFNSERNVRTNYPVSGTLQFELINNLIYGFRWATVPSLGAKFTVLNNKYKASSQVAIQGGAVVEGTEAGQGTPSQTYAFISGNILPSGILQNNSALSPYLKTTAYAGTGISTINASQIESDILQIVGASLPSRDAVDTRVINSYNIGTGSLTTSGTYPNIQGGSAFADSDNDGMPDYWEIENGLNINNASDRNVIQADGYTNLEYYLNGMTLQTDTVTANAGPNTEICEGSSTTLTASGGSSYEWSTGATTASITVNPNSTTTYTVTAYNASGSNFDTDDVTVTVNPLPTIDAGNDVTILSGESVTLTATGGTAYEWNTGATTQSITVNPTATTTYTVTGSANGCESTDSVTVTVQQAETDVVANAGPNTEICEGSSTILTASGGASYEWNTGATTASITVNPNSTTTYTVTAYNASGSNFDTDDVTVTVNPLPTIDAGNDVTILSGESVTLTATGGTAYEWNMGATTQSITVNPTATTTYTVTGSANGCESTDSVTVTVQQAETDVVANAGPNTEICEGSSTILTASGGASYEWNTGATTASITVNPNSTTTYTVTAYNAFGSNSDTDDVTVTVNPLPTIDAGNDVTILSGDSVTLTATGGTAYEWNTGASTQSITVNPTATTTYTVTGSANGCESTDSVTVTVQQSEMDVVANAGPNTEICEGSSTILTASGGSSYEWNTGATTASITVNPNSTTTYTVTAYNASGSNSDTDDVTVTVNPLPTIDAGNDVTILSGDSITLTATGGTMYEWSTGASTQSITVNPTVTTTYTVTGSANGCESTDSVTVTVQQSETDVVANAGPNTEICEGSSTILTASGGASYEWNTGATTASITVNPNSTTTYTVTAFNTSGSNSDTDDVTVTVNPLPTIDAGNDVTILSGNSVTLSATGGTTYEWNTGVSTQSITVNPTATTTFTVTGSTNGCESTDSVTVTVQQSETDVVANAGQDTEICEGSSTTLTASGGSSYEWSTGATTASITVNPNSTTTYTVTAHNASGSNSDTDDVTVTVNPLPTIDAGNDVTILSGDSITLTATGGTTYEWNTGASTQSITVNPTATTTYTVTGSANGCESTDSVTVTVQQSETDVVANAGPNTEICEGSSTILTASGGTSYEWNTGATTASITVNPNSTTTYTVTAYNAAGTNSDTDDVTVTVNPLPTIDVGQDLTINEGESVSLNATGGTSYLWSTGETTQSISVSPATITTFSVTGISNGCEGTDTVTITVLDTSEVVNAYAGEDVRICRGNSTLLTATGGDTYLWSTGETTASILVTPDHTDHYTVIAYIDGEHDEDEVTVFVSNNPNVVISNGSNVTILEGEYVTLSATGANTYEWSNGATQPNIAVSPNSTTNYSVTGYIYDCTDSKSVTVYVVPQVIAFATEDQTICLNESVTLAASGGDEFLWSNGETTSSIMVSPLETTEFSVTVYNELDYDTAEVMVTVEDCSTIEEPDDAEPFEFLVYPNPTSGNLNIKITGLLKVSSITMYDLAGKTLFHKTISTTEQLGFETTLDLSNYSNGLYLLNLVDNGRVITKKIVVNR